MIPFYSLFFYLGKYCLSQNIFYYFLKNMKKEYIFILFKFIKDVCISFIFHLFLNQLF